MAKNDNGNSAAAGDHNARLVTSPEDKVKASKWFQRARELGEKRQFDAAVEYYVNGLEYFPDAVEEACKPLHGCAVARRHTGGKKPGLKDTMKRSMNDKDARKAFVNALWLFGRLPDNIGYIEGVVRSAARLRAADAGQWAAGICLKALEATPKASVKQFQVLATALEEMGDRAAASDDSPFAVEVFQMGVMVLTLWRRRFAKDDKVDGLLKNLTTKLTILKGRYEESESYRDSIVDVEEQTDRHDRKRSQQSDDRMEDLIAKAEKQYRQDPDDQRKLRAVVDLLVRRERDDEETRAIGLLVEQYKRTDDYRWKHSADDVRMKQLGRRAREAKKTGDREKHKEQRIAQLRFELGVFKDRLDRYPTDVRVRFEYGVRNFEAGRFDEAIPLLQSARSDPKNRARCGCYLGRCFLRKGYYAQGITALDEALEDHEFSDDDLAKEMFFWLGRAQEAAGEVEAARATYGKILQLDYNYRDVRVRMDGLPAPG